MLKFALEMLWTERKKAYGLIVSHIIQSIHNFKDIENQVNLDINRIARNNFQLIKPKVTCVIINGNNNQLISSIKKEMKIFDEIIVANIQKELFTNKINCFLSKNKIQCYQYDNKQEIQNDILQYVHCSWCIFLEVNENFDKKNKDILYNIFSLFNEVIEKENIMFTFYNLKNNEYYHAHAIYSQHNHESNINVELNI